MDRSRYFPIYTIGHSTHDEDRFARLLLRHEINIVLDVRSLPYSRHAPHYNRPFLQSWLSRIGVKYSFGGRTLGGRPENPAVYVGAQVSYDLVASTESFISSLRRVALGARSARVALLCAEVDPIECHRFLLLGRALFERLFDVQHILPSGELESHSDGEHRMLRANGLEQTDAFSATSDALRLAYERQGRRFAFTKPSMGYPPHRLESA
jgi:uncharacterized protein (DUF488 family)